MKATTKHQSGQLIFEENMKFPTPHITPIKLAIHHFGVNPIYGDGVIHVESRDDAEGQFVIFSRPGSEDEEYAGKVCIHLSIEWPAVVKAVGILMEKQFVEEKTP